MKYEPQNGNCRKCKFHCEECGACLIYGNSVKKKEQCRKDFAATELKLIEKKLQYFPVTMQKDIRDAIEDPEIKTIFTYRIMWKKPWFDVGERLGIDRRTAARKFDGFLKGRLISDLTGRNGKEEM